MARSFASAVALLALGAAALLALGAAAAHGSDTRTLDALLAGHRRAAADGGWAPLPDGPALRPGQRHPTVAAVRARLAGVGLAPDAGPGDARRYDPSLVRAVEAFQRRHGLRVDGVIGARTRAALDVPAAVRLAQLELARRRLREPTPRGRWVRVNIPAFSLAVFDGGTPVLEMPIVVGRASRPTPVFESVISSVVVNPPWTVPPDLAYLDLLPKIRRDPRYLASRRMDVYESWELGARRLDPAQVDWERIGRGIERIALRQRPGPGNALGRFLLAMENERDVFLHDTPSRALFGEARRDFSSGCIRVADADALVREVLRDDATWAPARVAATVAAGETVAIAVREPVPIRIVYETVWVDRDGTVHVREDLYGEDVRQAARLRLVPPRVRTAAPAPPVARAAWEAPLLGAGRAGVAAPWP